MRFDLFGKTIHHRPPHPLKEMEGVEGFRAGTDSTDNVAELRALVVERTEREPEADTYCDDAGAFIPPTPVGRERGREEEWSSIILTPTHAHSAAQGFARSRGKRDDGVRAPHRRA